MYFALWGFAGACLVASTWLLSFAHIAHGRPRVLAFGMPTAVGLAAFLWAMKRLNDGSWSEEEVAPVQAVLEKPFFKCACFVLAAASLLPFIFADRHGGDAFILLLPAQAAMGIQQFLTRRKKRDGSSLPWDWRSFKPLRSEHWGKASR